MKRKILFFFLVGFSISAIAQEGSVGIGTQTPNEKAVLHLVAPNNDQGFLVPKLTTTQRNSFSAQLTSNENGMMVYDSDLNQFFFWLIDHWEAVGSSLQAGAGIEIVNGVITNTGDPDASDDFSGDWSDLANVPLEFEDGTDNVDDADNDPTNEIQDLNISGDILTITGVGTPTEIDLSVYNSASTDNQDLQFSAGRISLSGDPDNTIIDLSGYDTDVSDDFSGDWSDLTNVPAAFNDGVDDVDDADNDPLNEIELPATASTNDILVFDGTSWVAGTDQVRDADDDPNNEIELPSTAGIGQVLKYNDAAEWAPATDLVNDADSDPENEIQDLSLVGSTLTITGNSSATDINLESFVGVNTDSQDLQFDGSSITLTGDPDNTVIDLSTYNQTVTAGPGINVNQTGQDFTVTNSSPDQVVGLSAGSANVTVTGTYPNFTVDVPSLADGDSDPFNENQTVTGGTGISVNQVDQDFTVTNTSPDQVVGLSAGSANVTVTGTYPNFTVDVPSLADEDSDPNNENQTVTAGAGINVNQTGQDFTVTNSSPDQVVGLSAGSANVTVTGTYPNFTVDVPSLADGDSDPFNENQTVTGGTGISVNQVDQDFTVTNTSPDQVVGLAAGSGNVTVSGTYPNFTIDVPSLADGDSDPTNENQTVTGGAGISVNQVDQDFTVTNTSPDQVVGLSAGSANVTVTGTYPNFTVDVPSLADGDSDPFNENQTVTAGAGINVNQTGQNFTVTNANPDQVVGINAGSGNVTVTGTYPNFTVDVPSLNDADASTSNEIQDLNLEGNNLILSDDPTPAAIDLRPYLDNTDVLASLTPGEGQVAKFLRGIWVPADDNDSDLLSTITGAEGSVLKYFPGDGGWAAGTDFVDDADADAGNELQDLTYVGNVLSLDRDPTPTSIDFSGWDQDASDDFTNTDETDPTVPANIKDGIIWTEVGGIPADILDGDDVNDADSDPDNENQTVSNGLGISVVQTGQDFRITNTARDRTVSIRDGGSGNVVVGGSYPDFTIDVPSVSGNQLAFKAGKGEEQTFDNGVTITVTFQATSYNYGGIYNGADTFSPLVDGVYGIAGLITLSGNVLDAEIRIVVDGRTEYAIFATSEANLSSFPFQTDLRLTAGQRVSVTITGRSRGGTVVPVPSQTNWSGRLLIDLSR